MKFSRPVILSFILMIIIASLYRIMPGRPLGFAPQIAMAIFGGAIIKDKKFAFIMPLLSMFISDALYEILYRSGVQNMPGFYDGQVTNYILIGLLVCFGFFIKGFNVTRIVAASLLAPTAYFLLSNSLIWFSSSPAAGLGRPKTFNGLLLTLNDGLPFYKGSLAATVIFSAIFFSCYYFITKPSLQPAKIL